MPLPPFNPPIVNLPHGWKEIVIPIEADLSKEQTDRLRNEVWNLKRELAGSSKDLRLSFTDDKPRYIVRVQGIAEKVDEFDRRIRHISL